MNLAHDLTGNEYGFLTVIWRYRPSDAELQAHEYWKEIAVWLCECRCGKRVKVCSSSLTLGRTKSCGCLQVGAVVKANKTHGMSHTAEYRAWQQAKVRCFNPRHPSWVNYGGRGITMVEEWVNDFSDFLLSVGPKPKGRWVLDRIKNDQGYEPGNVHWTSYSVSNHNKRHGNEGKRKPRIHA